LFEQKTLQWKELFYDAGMILGIAGFGTIGCKQWASI
jgi:hypothetical protein